MPVGLQKMRDKIDAGKAGEEKATLYLKQNGYKILKRNFRNRLGEIDIIAKDKDTICFVEVRSRQLFSRHQEALESVGWLKQKKLSKVAASFLKKNNWWGERARFDVISVSLADPSDSIILLKDAFPVTENF